MNRPELLAWLTQWQGEFGTVLRTPLDRRTGSLRARSADYPATLVERLLPSTQLPAAERLAVYHRQYWFRLLGALQQAYPLMVRLFGTWHFNHLAGDFLQQKPPTTWDLQDIANGMVAFVGQVILPPQAEGVGPVDRQALIQAATIDEAFARVFAACELPAFAAEIGDAGRLLSEGLRAAPTWEIVRDDWELLALRQRPSVSAREESQGVAVKRAATSQWWAIFRVNGGHRVRPLVALQAQLLLRLREESLPSALAELERECTPSQRQGLVHDVQSWLAQSVQDRFWLALDPP